MNSRCVPSLPHLVLISLCATILAGASAAGAASAGKPHPDLSGNWLGRTGATIAYSFPSTVTANGSVNAGLATPEQGSPFIGNKPGLVQPVTGDPPAYKSVSDIEKAKQLYINGDDADNTVACGQPGLPRVGAPNKIVQTPKEIIFLYADLAGMVWRVIPVDGRTFRDRVDPSYYGDAVGHWEGDTLVVETRNFTDRTWFGEFGYFHSDQLRVIERLKRDGDQLTYQATVEDPVLLNKPWVKPPVILHATSEEIEEPPVCVPTHYDHKLDNHHVQRVP